MYLLALALELASVSAFQIMLRILGVWHLKWEPLCSVCCRSLILMCAGLYGKSCGLLYARQRVSACCSYL